MNSLRLEGQKTAAIEICQQFDWEVRQRPKLKFPAFIESYAPDLWLPDQNKSSCYTLNCSTFVCKCLIVDHTQGCSR